MARMVLSGGLALLAVGHVQADPAAVKPALPGLQAVEKMGAVPQPLHITGLVPETPEAVTNADGTASVNFTVNGTGSGVCDLVITTGQGGYVTAQVTAQSGFPKTMKVSFPAPSVTAVAVYGMQCAGKAQLMYNVKPHPEYPCSLHAGFKKELFFGNPNAVICRPTAPAATGIDSKRFNCGNGLVFTNAGNYVFGCLPPGTFAQ